jgi:hypothetical protein
MKMRTIIDLIENAFARGVPTIKAWINPEKNKFLILNFYDKHLEIVKKKRREFGLAKDEPEMNVKAVENGWVRFSSDTEGTRTGCGYVTAKDTKTVRKALLMVKKEGYLPEKMDIEIFEGGSRSNFFALSGDDLEKFISRGFVPRTV